jgi:hypothetical protein
MEPAQSIDIYRTLDVSSAGQWSQTSALAAILPQSAAAKSSTDFQTVWFVINFRDVVMTLNAYE